MKKHVKAMTYKPKIPYIRSGECRQTIRPGRSVCVGDQILFHGWEGRPYRSKWDWRLRITVTEAIPIMADYHVGIGIYTPEYDCVWHKWSSRYANTLATRDFIAPPNGIALRDVLAGLNNDKLSFMDCQIIRW